VYPNFSAPTYPACFLFEIKKYIYSRPSVLEPSRITRGSIFDCDGKNDKCQSMGQREGDFRRITLEFSWDICYNITHENHIITKLAVGNSNMHTCKQVM
jgi:hypothetical protein